MRETLHDSEALRSFSACTFCLNNEDCENANSCDISFCDDALPFHEDEYCEALVNAFSPSPAPLSGFLHKNDPLLYASYGDRNMINALLGDIRAGNIAYTTSVFYVGEILRFEPHINIAYKDGAFYISL